MLALHRMRSAQTAVERPSSQSAAANTDYANRIERAPDFGGVTQDFFDRAGLKWQVRETIPAIRQVLAEITALKAAQRVASRARALFTLGWCEPMLFTHHLGKKIRLVKVYGNVV